MLSSTEDIGVGTPFSRMLLIDLLLHVSLSSFFQLLDPGKKQIVSLGSGYDTTFFNIMQ
jgi:hypothetical protein